TGAAPGSSCRWARTTRSSSPTTSPPGNRTAGRSRTWTTSTPATTPPTRCSPSRCSWSRRTAPPRGGSGRRARSRARPRRAFRRRSDGIEEDPMTVVPPSRLQLPPGPWRTVLEALCARFPRIPEAQWRERFIRGRVLDRSGTPLPLDAPYRVGAQVQYFREVAEEPALPGGEAIVHCDADLLVAFKPHYLPVAPTGAWVRETLLARMIARTGNTDLAPLHRLDRDTAGLVLFSTRPA